MSSFLDVMSAAGENRDDAVFHHAQRKASLMLRHCSWGWRMPSHYDEMSIMKHRQSRARWGLLIMRCFALNSDKAISRSLCALLNMSQRMSAVFTKWSRLTRHYSSSSKACGVKLPDIASMAVADTALTKAISAYRIHGIILQCAATWSSADASLFGAG